MKNYFINTRLIAITIIMLLLISNPLSLYAQDLLTKANIEKVLNDAYAKFKDVKEGANADYIKELATVDPNIFGIALVTTDGQVYHSWRYQINGINPKCFKSIYNGKSN